eukprot:m51a1_g10996 hypothetical protein (261) ;mRNA; f:342078-343058
MECKVVTLLFFFAACLAAFLAMLAARVDTGHIPWSVVFAPLWTVSVILFIIAVRMIDEFRGIGAWLYTVAIALLANAFTVLLVVQLSRGSDALMPWRVVFSPLWASLALMFLIDARHYLKPSKDFHPDWEGGYALGEPSLLRFLSVVPSNVLISVFVLSILVALRLDVIITIPWWTVLAPWYWSNVVVITLGITDVLDGALSSKPILVLSEIGCGLLSGVTSVLVGLLVENVIGSLTAALSPLFLLALVSLLLPCGQCCD